MPNLIIKNALTQKVVSTMPLRGNPPKSAVRVGGDFVVFQVGAAAPTSTVGYPTKTVTVTRNTRKTRKSKAAPVETDTETPVATVTTDEKQSAESVTKQKKFIIIRDADTGKEIARKEKGRGRPDRMWVPEGNNVVLYMRNGEKVSPGPGVLPVSPSAPVVPPTSESSPESSPESVTVEHTPPVAQPSPELTEQPVTAPKPITEVPPVDRRTRIEDIAKSKHTKQSWPLTELKKALSPMREEITPDKTIVMTNVFVTGKTGWDFLKFNDVYAKIEISAESNWIKVWDTDAAGEPDCIILNGLSSD